MYKDKGHIKVYNGNKYRTISYLNEDGVIMFCTSKLSNKYSSISKTNIIKVLEGSEELEYSCTIIEDENVVDEMFSKLKKTKTIPFFIPRKNKIIMKYSVK